MEQMKDRLYEAMVRAGKKQSDIANDLEIPKSAISQYLSGHTEKMDTVRLYQIAEYLRVNPLWLLGFDEPMNEKEKALLEAFRKMNGNEQDYLLSLIKK